MGGDRDRDGIVPLEKGGPPYLHELAVAHGLTVEHGSDAYNNCLDDWKNKFLRINYLCFSSETIAAFAEVTPLRPPFDYPGQQRSRLFSRNSAKEWHSSREVIISLPAGDQFSHLNTLLTDLSDLYLKASNFTDPEDAAFCHRLLRGTLQQCIVSYDEQPAINRSGAFWHWRPPWYQRGPLTPIPPPDSLLRKRDEVVDAYRRCAERRTVSHYILGMFIGLFGLAALILLNMAAFSLLDRQGVQLPSNMKGIISLGNLIGATGAISSVLLRINSTNVDLDVESTRHGYRIWANPAMQRGFARVIIGSIFGGISAWFVVAGFLIPESARGGTDESTTAAMIGALAYIAGFSERFIPDLVMRRSTGK